MIPSTTPTSFRLETPRLRLRPINAATDAAGFVELNADPEVTRYTGDGPFDSVAAAERFFAERLAQYARAGMGRWAVELRATGELLGWCGLRRPEAATDAPEVDLGYRFFRRQWGNGYATEAARACLTHGFDDLSLPQIIVQIDPANVASLAVARKLGFRPRPGLHACGSLPAVQVLELTAAEWRSETAGA